MSVLKDKELRIVGFLCNWCSYGGADTAGTARASQPTDLRIIRVPCSGRVNPLFVLKALLNGADGVLVSGCHPRDCHYSLGNLYARRRLELLKEFLPIIGIDPRRFHYTWVSASEGQRWKSVVTDFTEVVHELGKAPAWKDAAPYNDVRIEALPPLRDLSFGPAPDLDDLKGRIKEALPGLDGVLGWKQGFDGLHSEPVLMTTPEEVDGLIWGPFNVQNLAVYLPQYKGRKIGIVVKGCDSKSIVEQVAEKLIDRGSVTVFSMACKGTVDIRKIQSCLPPDAPVTDVRAEGGALRVAAGGGEYAFAMADVAQDKCRMCEAGNAGCADVFVGEKNAPAEAPEDTRSAALRFLDELTLEQRMGFWKGQMERCIRCYACRSACPLCVCRDNCVSDSRDPEWLTQEDDVTQKFFFQLIHAQHLAGRCTGCGECQRACPMEIPVFALKQQYGRIVKRIFGYSAGMDAEATPPLLGYQIDEPNIKEHEIR